MSTTSSDELITALNGAQDIMVRAVSCRDVLQELINRRSLSHQVAEPLGELVASTLLMASGLKGDETLQVNLVGTGGAKSLTAIADGQLRVKAICSTPSFSVDVDQVRPLPLSVLLGEGQVQVIRTHPSWKSPMQGLIALEPQLSIPMNVALYLAQSEQRRAAMLTHVRVSPENKVLCAVGVLVETLPDAVDANVERSITNLQAMGEKGIESYFTGTPEAAGDAEALHKIVDGCLQGMEENSFRYGKKPEFTCHCSLNKVKAAIKLLPVADVQDLLSKGEGVQMKCEFCGSNYNLSDAEVKSAVESN